MLFGHRNLQSKFRRYYPGTNDSLGADPDGNPFNSSAFSPYSSWEDSPDAMRRKIAAGEKLFNTRPLTISNVRGLTDNAALAKVLGTTVPIAPFQGFCTTCHEAPNVGNHSLPWRSTLELAMIPASKPTR